ncbi:60S ribosomal protein L25, variant 2 [Entomophthora muscae]|uniref:60S ribosomal protein L25, variant 2 n=2 Tax=Entomophthora muscae TaxID=34485 RepID=A0ACC2SDQ4_9FUNG|nr:60S ribosomal protein L25 [Entomophthora muscae]KAJ9060496.1 60S ribosomal protein L25, variant 2 [Entomophthora muscae]
MPKREFTRASRLKGLRKIRTSVSFHRPKTLKLARKPLYPRNALPKESVFDQYAVIKKPLNTEHAMKRLKTTTLLYSSVISVLPNPRSSVLSKSSMMLMLLRLTLLLPLRDSKRLTFV